MARLLFSIDGAGAGKKFQVSSPDVTCDLSFSASATSLLSDPYAPQDLPEGELAKLDGPATISGDTLQVSVHNGTTWNIKEITVGVTLLRGSEANTRRRGTARLIPAAETTTLLSEKQPDSTVLYHLKGSAAPSSTTVFHETLGTKLGQDQEWHWAIVQAKGIPRSPPSHSRQQLLRYSLPLFTYLKYIFRFAAIQTSIGRIQNFLILPAFFAGHRKFRFALDRVREGVDLLRVGQAI